MPVSKARGAVRTARLLLLTSLLIGSGWTQALEIEVRGHRVNYSPFTLVAQPGEPLRIGVSGQVESSGLTLEGQAAGRLVAGVWQLDAPAEPGRYTLQVREAHTGGRATLNLFVSVPSERVEDGYLSGYRMGPPPPGNTRHPEQYRAPAGFIEVTADNVDTLLTPHFRLRQFLCKQAGDYPKYVVLQESLLVLLEGLLREVVDAGYPAETFGVISGYRTPWYNKYIGNVPNSRHVYGDAMDLFLDLDGDGNMDDLDGDGDQDREDVTLLYNIAEKFMQRPGNAALLGGIGRYRKTSRHGGFVHVDTRGYKARW